MSRSAFALILAIGFGATGPVAAQSLTTLLPNLSFPETVTPATKGCDPAVLEDCPAER